MTWSSRSIASRETASPLLGAPNVEVVLRHFHRSRYRSSSLWFFSWRGLLVSWSLAMDERGGHKDLRGSGHRSIIPYIHGRTELYCSSLYEPKSAYLSAGLDRSIFLTPVKRCLPGPFIAQGRVVTMRPGARQVAPRWLKPYTASSALVTRSS
jgi:hypothetical protein